MFHIVWRFRAKPDRVAQFHHAYDPDGTWAQLFRKSLEYRGTQLWQDSSDPLSFLVVDTWASRKAFTSFRTAFASEYEVLDRECEQLTDEEVKVGEYTSEESGLGPIHH